MAQAGARVRLAAGAAALVLLLAACAERSSTGASTGGGGDSPTADAGGGAYGGTGDVRGGYGYGGGGAGGGGAQTGGDGSSVLTVGQDNFRFSPATLTVKSGDTITVTNDSASTPHTFTITGSNVDVTNDGGASQDVTIDLTPGTYEFVCRFHESLEMTGTITVE